MEASDLTVQILQIRDELRTGRKETRAELRTIRTQLTQHDQRFEVIETQLRDLSQQMVMLSRGIKVSIKDRQHLTSQLDDHEKRLRALEDHGHN